MEAITLPILNVEGKEVDTIKLDSSVFDGQVNEAVVYQVINAFRASQRQGTAATKTRGEVSGGGKKPWKQKGTGRSRHGSTRSPIWRHGGVVFGPHPRDFSIPVSKKIRNLALKSCLNAKVKENNLFVLDALSLGSGKTKDAAKVFANLKLNTKKGLRKLILVDKIDDKSRCALRNLDLLNVNIADNTNAYEVLVSGKIVITKDGMQALVKRLK